MVSSEACEEAPGGDDCSDILQRWSMSAAVTQQKRSEQSDCEEDFLCPTVCDCKQDDCACKDLCRRFVFCEWCRSWQHQCCAQRAVGYQQDPLHGRPRVTAKGFYDTTQEYMCFQCVRAKMVA